MPFTVLHDEATREDSEAEAGAGETALEEAGEEAGKLDEGAAGLELVEGASGASLDDGKVLGDPTTGTQSGDEPKSMLILDPVAVRLQREGVRKC